MLSLYLAAIDTVEEKSKFELLYQRWKAGMFINSEYHAVIICGVALGLFLLPMPFLHRDLVS